MESIEALRALAKAIGRAEFIGRFAHGVLLKRPDPGHGAGAANPFDDEDEASGRRIGFATRIIHRESLALDLLDDDGGPEETGWIIVPIAKREGNPYPERISVGRATNCDMVLRVPSVSKLHAHFRLEDGRIAHITDANSGNGTFVNGVVVPVGEGLPVSVGDRVQFGGVTLEIVPPVEAYAVLASLSTPPR